ncbi:MAG: AAA family ATPase [Deltaproteobacteria bacterium RIFOXYD12_FULL_50_9]|nr:MAG: AAA family ATPase [Deltaproteobacteria bacterium RIFOXYD12_FULL_50_9]
MKESESIEFKKSLAELKAGLVSIAAILNKHGAGELWFGIRNDGKVVGLVANEKTLRDISQSIAAHIEPKIYPQVSIEKVDGLECVKVAFIGKDGPYFAYGRAYMRVADEDRQLSAKELENLILAKNREALRWDNAISSAMPQDLNVDKMKFFVERAGLTWDTADNALAKLGLIHEGHLLNAAPLFFAKQPVMQLRCAVFATTDSATILDRHDFDGDILELIEEAQKYIQKNIHIGMRLEGLYRVDVPEISVEAMREAIINAFCHRDYRDPDYVQIAVFKNRVEIRNPGGLYDDMTIEKMLQGNVSKRRNPLVADLLRRIHMVEAWGRGMPLILKNAPDVKFREIAHIFIVAFDRPSFANEEGFIDETIDKGRPVTGKTGETTKETPKKHQRNTKETILATLKDNPGISVRELAGLLGSTENSVRHHIRKFHQSGILRHEGPTKGGLWVIEHG